MYYDNAQKATLRALADKMVTQCQFTPAKTPEQLAREELERDCGPMPELP
jgi:hypothetical protein